MELDFEKTKNYYSLLSHDAMCDCDYCKLYYAKSRTEYPELAKWLDGYGIDITKPFEIMSVGPDDKGVIDYLSVQYAAFGSCPEDFSCKVGETEVGFCKCHPSTGIKEDHFVLDVCPMKLLLN